MYLLAGLVRCRPCGRRMDAHWVNNRAGYRCRHGHTSAQRATPDRAKNLYVREDHILASLPAHLAVLELDDELDPKMLSAAAPLSALATGALLCWSMPSGRSVVP